MEPEEVLMIIGGSILLVSVIFCIVGFGPFGIMAGSAAASAQCIIGNVPAGSIFAFLQSSGASGYFIISGLAGLGMFCGGLSAELIFNSKKFQNLIDLLLFKIVGIWISIRNFWKNKVIPFWNNNVIPFWNNGVVPYWNNNVIPFFIQMGSGFNQFTKECGKWFHH